VSVVSREITEYFLDRFGDCLKELQAEWPRSEGLHPELQHKLKVLALESIIAELTDQLEGIKQNDDVATD
jgi:hypothetical protein